MANASGIAKKLRYIKEVIFGVLPVGTGQSLRRVSSDLSLTKDVFESQEIRDDYQVGDERHGMRKAGGKIGGELSPGTFARFFEAALRALKAVAGITTAQITIAAVLAGLTRTAGDFLADGHRVGHVVRFAGFTGGSAGNNGNNFLITAVDALTMTGVFLNGYVMVPQAAGAAITITTPGGHISVPLAGHTDDSFAFEHFFSDIGQSELFLGQKVDTIDVQLPPTGIAKIDIGLMGVDMVSDEAEQIVAPNPATTTGVLTAVNGRVFLAGTRKTALTGMKFTVSSNMTSEAVIGSDVAPEVTAGRVKVKGDLTAMFKDGTERDAFESEAELPLIAVFTASKAPAADFVAFMFPRCKLNGSSKDDGEKTLIQSIPFVALRGTGANGARATTLQIQDSQA